jgi:hypothetical protein
LRDKLVRVSVTTTEVFGQEFRLDAYSHHALLWGSLQDMNLDVLTHLRDGGCHCPDDAVSRIDRANVPAERTERRDDVLKDGARVAGERPAFVEGPTRETPVGQSR